MKSVFLLVVFFLISIFSFAKTEASLNLSSNASIWKAGVARVVITPQEPMWMAGYGSRDRPSEGTLHDLWAKALVLEDAKGEQAVMISTDLLGIPKNVSDRIRNRLEANFGLSRAQILINSSHTHSGPVLENSLSDIYPLNAQQLERVEQYTEELEDKLVALVGEALGSMVPVQLYAENGVTRFQVNRRNNSESLLNRQTELEGPNDYAVPVIKVVNGAGEMIAVAFGYACHPTVLNGYEWSGDYAGFAQLELEEKYPNTTALFFQGAGGDQNPLPRRTIALAQQYGQTLATAVERVLNEEMRQLSPKISTAYSEIALPLTTSPTQEEFTEIAEESSGYQKRWAARLSEQMERGEELITSYPYPLQVWKLDDQLIFSLGGELVVEYAINLKEIFGHDIFVLGYSNDVMGYIPSATILKEGGYEGESSQMVYGLPAPWASSIEVKILHGLIQLAEQVGVVNSGIEISKN